MSIKGYSKSTCVKRLRAIFAAALLLSLFGLSGCASFPAPGSEDSSLLVVLVDPAPGREEEPAEVREDEGGEKRPSAKTGSDAGAEIEFTGPREFSLSARGGPERRAHFIKVEPGSYGYRDPAGGEELSFGIPPDTVYLMQRKLVFIEEHEGSFTFKKISPQERKWVSEELESYIGFYDWYGKSFAGFGPYTPRFTFDEARYEVEISSEPAGARVVIDEREWGRTPITVQLEAGKHLLRLEQDGFSPAQTYLNISGKSRLKLSLEKKLAAGVGTEEGAAEGQAITGGTGSASGDEGGGDPSVYRTVVFPLKNTGGGDFDHIGPLFADGITSGLYNRENVQLLEPSSEKKQAAVDMTAAEAMATAEGYGAELMVSGSYYVRDGKVSVNAALYDVRTNQVKTATLSTGKAGLAMFETIDGITAEFLENLDRALPAVGKEVIEEKQVVTQELVRYQQGASVKEIHRSRHKKKNSLAVLSGLGQMDYADRKETDMAGPNYTNSGVMWGMLQYERSLSARLSLANRLVFPVSNSFSEGMGMHLFSGPQLGFGGKRSEISIGVPAHIIYNPPATYSADSGEGEETVDKGNIWSIGLAFDLNLKFYMNRRLDTTPRFLQLGFSYDKYITAYEVEAGTFNRYSLGIMLYMGYGVRF